MRQLSAYLERYDSSNHVHETDFVNICVVDRHRIVAVIRVERKRRRANNGMQWSNRAPGERWCYFDSFARFSFFARTVSPGMNTHLPQSNMIILCESALESAYPRIV
jgi:hypothetical protein